MIKDTLDSYDLGQIIGKGGFASVYRAIHRSSGREVAIKITEKDRMSKLGMTERIANEVKIHSTLPHHINVINAISTFEDDHNIYLVMDLCVKGNLYKELRKKKRFCETEAKHVIQQLLSAVSHLHSEGIVHRDLKLSNILIEDPSASNTSSKRGREGETGMDYYRIKICDFGLAIQIEHPDEEHFTLCGTPNYIAPEIADHKAHGYPVDLWSIGCLFYTLVVGSPPFEQRIIEEKSDDHNGNGHTGSQNNTTVFKNMKSSDYKIPEDVKLSTQGKLFLTSLLDWNPSRRASAADTVKHPFFRSPSTQGAYPGAESMRCSSNESYNSINGNLLPLQHSSSSSISISTGTGSPGGNASQRATPVTQVIHRDYTPTASRNNTPMRAPKANKAHRRAVEREYGGRENMDGEGTEMPPLRGLTLSLEADLAVDDSASRWRARSGFEQAPPPTAKHSKHPRLCSDADDDIIEKGERGEREASPRTIPASLSALPVPIATPTGSLEGLNQPVSRHPKRGALETSSAASCLSSYNDDIASHLSLHLPHPSAEPSLVMPISSITYYQNNGGVAKNLVAKIEGLRTTTTGMVRARGVGHDSKREREYFEDVSASQRQTTDLSKMRCRLHTIASTGGDVRDVERAGESKEGEGGKEAPSLIDNPGAYKRVPVAAPTTSPFVSSSLWEGKDRVGTRVSHNWLDEVSSLRNSLVNDGSNTCSTGTNNGTNNGNASTVAERENGGGGGGGDGTGDEKRQQEDVLLSVTSLSEYNNENRHDTNETNDENAVREGSPSTVLTGPRPALGELPRKGFSSHYYHRMSCSRDGDGDGSNTVRSSVTQSTEAFTIPDASITASYQGMYTLPQCRGSSSDGKQLQYTPHPPSVPPGANDRYTHARSSMYSSMNRSSTIFHFASNPNGDGGGYKSMEMRRSLQGAKPLAKSWCSSPRSAGTHGNRKIERYPTKSPLSESVSTPPGSRPFLLWQTEVRDLTPFCYVTPQDEVLLYSVERDLLFCVPMLRKNGRSSYARMLFRAHEPLMMSVGHVDEVMMREIKGIVAGTSPSTPGNEGDGNGSNGKSTTSTAFGRMYSQSELRVLEEGSLYSTSHGPSCLRASASMAPDARLWVAKHRLTRLPEGLLKVYSRVGMVLGAVRSNAPRIILYMKRSTIRKELRENGDDGHTNGASGSNGSDGSDDGEGEISMMTDPASDKSPPSPSRPLDRPTGPFSNDHTHGSNGNGNRNGSGSDDHTIDCKCMLMCNDPLPNFTIQWIDGTRLRYALSTGNLQLDCPAQCPAYKSLPASLHPIPTNDKNAPASAYGGGSSGSSGGSGGSNSVSEALLLGLDDGDVESGLAGGYDYSVEQEESTNHNDSALDTTAETTLDTSYNNGNTTTTTTTSNGNNAGETSNGGSDREVTTGLGHLDEEGSQGPEPCRRPCPLPSPRHDAQQDERERKRETEKRSEHTARVAKALCYETRLYTALSHGAPGEATGGASGREWEDIPERLKGYMQIAQMAMQQVVRLRKEQQEAVVGVGTYREREEKQIGGGVTVL